MKTPSLIALTSLLLLTSSASAIPPAASTPRPIPRPWHSCTTTTWATPLAQSFPGCQEGSCSCDPSGSELCVCYCKSSHKFTWLDKDTVRASWRATMAPNTSFEVHTTNLDGTGAPEVIIAGRNTQSPTPTWNIAVLTQNASAPLLMTTATHGPHSYIKAAHGARCDLLDVQHRTINGKKHLTGRRMRLRYGELLPANSWRVTPSPSPGDDLGKNLLQGDNVFLDPADVLNGPQFPPPRVGTIVSVSLDAHPVFIATLRFKVRLRQNLIIDIPYQENADLTDAYQYLGYGRTPFPEGYIPAHLGQEWTGRRIWLEEREDGTIHLWLQGKAKK